MPDNDTDNLAAVTDELLKLEEDFSSEISDLRQQQEAALKRLRTAIDQVKIDKIADRLRPKSE